MIFSRPELFWQQDDIKRMCLYQQTEVVNVPIPHRWSDSSDWGHGFWSSRRRCIRELSTLKVCCLTRPSTQTCSTYQQHQQLLWSKRSIVAAHSEKRNVPIPLYSGPSDRDDWDCQKSFRRRTVAHSRIACIVFTMHDMLHDGMTIWWLFVSGRQHSRANPPSSILDWVDQKSPVVETIEEVERRSLNRRRATSNKYSIHALPSLSWCFKFYPRILNLGPDCSIFRVTDWFIESVALFQRHLCLATL